MHNIAGLERSKLEKLTELQSRTIEGVGMVLATPAPPEAKVAEADAIVRHYQELKDALIEQRPAVSAPPANREHH